MFQGFESNPSHTGDTCTPLRPMRPPMLPKSKTSKKAHKSKHKKKRLYEEWYFENQLLALAIHELGASTRMMAQTLSEIAQGKELFSPSIEAKDFRVSKDEEEG